MVRNIYIYFSVECPSNCLECTIIDDISTCTTCIPHFEVTNKKDHVCDCKIDCTYQFYELIFHVVFKGGYLYILCRVS